MKFLVNTPACLIGMEASCGCNHTGRQLTGFGHDVRLIPAQFVKPYVKSQKNDYADAEAIAEAVQRPTMRFVTAKTEDLLDIQAMHRVRERLLEQRTSLVNQLRAFLLERGLTRRTGRAYLWRVLPEVMAEVEKIASPRMLISAIVQQWRALEVQINDLDSEIALIAKTNEACQRLQTLPGVGPLASTAMVAAVGNGSAFEKGRQFSARLGLVPQQRSTGGQTKLLGISKRGNEYLRRLFIHGARSVALQVKRDRHAWGRWLTALQQRTQANVATVALANKLARIVWTVLCRNESYHFPDTPTAA